jgi:hypothetical protein
MGYSHIAPHSRDSAHEGVGTGPSLDQGQLDLMQARSRDICFAEVAHAHRRREQEEWLGHGEIKFPSLGKQVKLARHPTDMGRVTAESVSFGGSPTLRCAAIVGSREIAGRIPERTFFERSVDLERDGLTIEIRTVDRRFFAGLHDAADLERVTEAPGLVNKIRKDGFYRLRLSE